MYEIKRKQDYKKYFPEDNPRSWEAFKKFHKVVGSEVGLHSTKRLRPNSLKSFASVQKAVVTFLQNTI